MRQCSPLLSALVVCVLTDQPPRPWERPYNGFSWRERCAVTPLQNAAIRSGKLIRPTVCCICGDSRDQHPKGRDYRFLHTEDYRKPLSIYPCCKPCHAALHARFEDPARWQRVVSAHGQSAGWILALSLDPMSQWRPFDQIYARGLPGPDLKPSSPPPISQAGFQFGEEVGS